jgi:hypothetical protein
MAQTSLEPQFRAAKRTDLDDLNDLIDWYEKYKPESGKCIQIWKTPQELHKLLSVTPSLDEKQKPVYPQELPYRGRTILAIGHR